MLYCVVEKVYGDDWGAVITVSGVVGVWGGGVVRTPCVAESNGQQMSTLN